MIVRDITVLCESSGTNTLAIFRTGGEVLWLGESTAANSYFHEEGRKVLNAGDSITTGVGSGTWSLHISGYQLS